MEILIISGITILGFIGFIILLSNIYASGYRDGQLDYHKGIIKYTFTNEVVAVEK